jgi:GNAT superfamily N-acetyltransferase
MIKLNHDGCFVEYQEIPNVENEQALFDGISDDGMHSHKKDRIRSFGVFIKNADRVVIGGVTGVTFYGCLYIDMLWVDHHYRKQKYATQLMQEAEEIGRTRKAAFALVNTFEWQALPLYLKLGYEVEFVREGFEGGSKMYLLRKVI